MSKCSSCEAEIDADARAAGRCPQCGVLLHNVPQRTVADLPEINLEKLREQPTIVAADDETAKPSGETDAEGDAPPDKTLQTVALGGEATVDLGTMELDVDGSMLTSQWESNFDGAPTDSHATVRVKDTVGGSFITKSSLIVKSRRVADQPSEVRVGSLDDAPDYELIDVIGEGGMGVVYAARQSSIARTVAVKMLKPDARVTNEQREKFISEAVVTGELDHPNIVPIYDLGANDKGALFYSMKRVRGTPWNDVIQDRSLDENLSILLRVADAVAFAHKNGVVHRDLKPENIMLGDFGEVLVMDWGLARISPEFPNSDSVSQSNAMGGTPAYMAPEMASGPIDAITTASDIYLLGGILYEIVAGHPPHSGKNVMECIFHAAKNRIVPTEESGELVEIALQAMAAEPADRYETVQAFQAAIRQYQAHSESIVLTDNSANYLAEARDSNSYDLYARSLFGLEEAIELWSGNQRAEGLLNEARADYAQAALANGDLDLAASLIDSNVDEHAALHEAIEEARQHRLARQRRFQALKLAVAALIAAVITIVSISYVAVRNQRDRAVTAEAEARENYRQAELARQDAVAQRDRAVRAEAEANKNFLAAEAARQDAVAQRDRAEQQKQIAESQRARAEREEQNAREQEQLAVAAKQAEEYAAYVARIGLAHAKIEENAFDRAVELLAQCNPLLRHWEWGRLKQLCSLSQRTWRVGAPVDAIAVSPDGQYFAIGDWQGRARVYDLETGELASEFRHGEYVHAVAFDPTGQFLATGSSDHRVNVYRLADGQQVKQFMGHDDAVLSVAFSPDGQLLVSSGYDNTARVWDVAESETLQVLERHHWWVWDAEFSPDGKQIVTAGQDGKVVVWQRGADPTYRRQTEFTQHQGAVYDASFSPDGTQIATAGYDGRVLLWRPEAVAPVDIERRLDALPDAPTPFVELLAHQGPVRTVAFDPTGASVVSGGQDNVVILWDVATQTVRNRLRGHASHVRSVAFAESGDVLLSASRDQDVRLWRPDQYAEVRRMPASADAVLSARYSSDGAQIVTASRDRTAALWDAATLEQIAQLDEGHEFLASSAQFFAAGTRLATAAGDGTVRIWDVATGTEVDVLAGVGVAGALAADERGARIAAGGDNNEATIWDVRTGTQLAALAGHQSEVTAACFAPGGELLATGDDRGVCRLWQYDAATDNWQAIAELSGHSRTITALHFVDQGRRLVTASGDNTCGQWDVAAQVERTDLVLKHPAWVADMAIRRDGQQALTCCDDGALRLWSLADAALLKTFRALDAQPAFTSVDISPDGRLALAVSATEGTVRIWNIETGEHVTVNDERGSQQPWLNVDQNGGLLWAARFAPAGDAVLTIGGNDARLFDIESRGLMTRFSPHGAVASADVSPDGRQVITGSWDRSAKLWNVDAERAVLKLDGVHAGPINCVRYSPNGQMALTASDDGVVRLWDPANGKSLGPPLEVSEGRVLDASFSPDGRWILTASDDKTARIFAVDDRSELVRFAGHEWAVLRAQFSSDARLVITGSEDNTARVWNVEQGTEVIRLAGHTGAVTAVALSPDGRRAATGSVDNSVKLWDAQTGKEILTLSEHDEAVTAVSFSPDGQTILSSGRDGRTLLWPATPWDDVRNAAAPDRLGVLRP